MIQYIYVYIIITTSSLVNSITINSYNFFSSDKSFQDKLLAAFKNTKQCYQLQSPCCTLQSQTYLFYYNQKFITFDYFSPFPTALHQKNGKFNIMCILSPVKKKSVFSQKPHSKPPLTFHRPEFCHLLLPKPMIMATLMKCLIGLFSSRLTLPSL